MDDFSSSSYRTYVSAAQNLDIVHGKAYDMSNVYVTHPPPSIPYHEVFRSNKKAISKSGSSWLNDPEFKRRKRIAKYKWYSVEGKIKGSLKNGFRWFKRTCREIIRGF